MLEGFEGLGISDPAFGSFQTIAINKSSREDSLKSLKKGCRSLRNWARGRLLAAASFDSGGCREGEGVNRKKLPKLIGFERAVALSRPTLGQTAPGRTPDRIGNRS